MGRILPTPIIIMDWGGISSPTSQVPLCSTWEPLFSSNSHAYRILNKSTGLIEETCNVEFDENNGSQVEQSGTCDVGDEIPPQAIRRMGVGFILPIEEPLVAEGEGQCSTWEPLFSSNSTLHVSPISPVDLLRTR